MSQTQWREIITPKKKLISLNLREIWNYRDLLFLFVKRDVVTIYKQTILGPLWFLIQPLFTSLIYTIIFNGVAEVKTGEVPPFLFNLSGVILWNYFADCFSQTSDTFKKNEDIFGKVYFPRAVMPLSIVVSNLVKLGIQLLIFLSVFLYYYFSGALNGPSLGVIYMPILIILMGISGLSLGLITSSLTTKYRDLVFLAAFGIQLLMFMSAVMYPIEMVAEKLPVIEPYIKYNPLAVTIDLARQIYFFDGGLDLGVTLLYPLACCLALFLIGLALFNKTEKSFIDTI